MVVDVTAGITPLDIEIARKLRTSGKPIFLAVNKVDNPQRDKGVAEFAALGLRMCFRSPLSTGWASTNWWVAPRRALSLLPRRNRPADAHRDCWTAQCR